MTLKIDLHVHSCYSRDSIITLEKLVFYARRRGLDGVAVTDHDSVQGAIQFARQTDLLIIPGIEVSTAGGHVVGLGVQDLIPRGLSVAYTVERIHEASGIAVFCHPSAFFKGSVDGDTSARFDAVEVMNSSAIPFKHSVNQGEKIAARLGLPRVAGSDAHFGPDIGCAYTETHGGRSVDDAIADITKGRCEPRGKSIPALMRIRREAALMRRKIRLI